MFMLCEILLNEIYFFVNTFFKDKQKTLNFLSGIAVSDFEIAISHSGTAIPVPAIAISFLEMTISISGTVIFVFEITISLSGRAISLLKIAMSKMRIAVSRLKTNNLFVSNTDVYSLSSIL